MFNILVVDFSSYKNTIAEMFNNSGYNVKISESAFDAMAMLKTHDFDLVVSEVELPGDNAFDLHNYIKKYYPYIPTIMTTGKNIDPFFSRIFQEGIGNVLCKPLKRDELLNLAEKLITKKNIFGLQNYLKDIKELKKITITSSNQIKKGIQIIIKHIEEWGFEDVKEMILNLLLSEIIINAVYHSHGYTREKEKSLPVQLKDGECVDVFFAGNETAYGISINDYQGNLSKTRILESINRTIEQSRLMMESIVGEEKIFQPIAETGRGLDLVRKLAGEYYYIIKKNVQTEVIIIFDKLIYNDSENHTSLKIIEDLL